MNEQSTVTITLEEYNKLRDDARGNIDLHYQMSELRHQMKMLCDRVFELEIKTNSVKQR